VPVPIWSAAEAAPALAVPRTRQHGRGASQPRQHAPGDVRGRQPQAQRARAVLGGALLVRRGLALAAARLAHPAALPRVLRRRQARRPCPCPRPCPRPCRSWWPPARSAAGLRRQRVRRPRRPGFRAGASAAGQRGREGSSTGAAGRPGAAAAGRARPGAGAAATAPAPAAAGRAGARTLAPVEAAPATLEMKARAAAQGAGCRSQGTGCRSGRARTAIGLERTLRSISRALLVPCAGPGRSRARTARPVRARTARPVPGVCAEGENPNGCPQAPKPSPAELSPEELQTVALFQENTPSVVNIANIGARGPGLLARRRRAHGACAARAGVPAPAMRAPRAGAGLACLPSGSASYAPLADGMV